MPIARPVFAAPPAGTPAELATAAPLVPPEEAQETGPFETRETGPFEVPLTGDSPSLASLGDHPPEQHQGEGQPGDHRGPVAPDGAMALQRLPLANQQVGAPVTGHPVGAPVTDPQVEASFAGHVAEAPLTGHVGPLPRLQALRVDDAPTQGFAAPRARTSGSLRIGVPVPAWRTADPAPGGGAGPEGSSPYGGSPTDGGSAAAGAPDLPPPRTLIPLSRMFSESSEAPPVGDDAPLAVPGAPGTGARLGIGMPLPGSLAQPGGAAPPSGGPLHLQRRGFLAGHRRRATGSPAGAPAPSPSDSSEEPSSAGFTEVAVEHAAGQPTDDTTVTSPGAWTVAQPDPAPASAPRTALPTGRDLDALVERLYEPLTARLKTELWLDRERSGLMINLRR